MAPFQSVKVDLTVVPVVSGCETVGNGVTGSVMSAQSMCFHALRVTIVLIVICLTLNMRASLSWVYSF